MVAVTEADLMAVAGAIADQIDAHQAAANGAELPEVLTFNLSSTQCTAIITALDTAIAVARMADIA